MYSISKVFLFTVIDTAGVRDVKRVRDPVEKEGIRRTEHALKSSDMVLFVVDNSRLLGREDETIVKMIQKEQKPVIGVINKVDLKTKIQPAKLKELMKGIRILKVSALYRKGIKNLIRILYNQALSGSLPEEGELVLTNARHYQSIVKAKENISQALASLEKGLSQEFLALDLRSALESIGEITGQTTTDDVLNHIFLNFCIGK